jgi:hypothetical protein
MSEPLPPIPGPAVRQDDLADAGPGLSAPFLRCGGVTGAAVSVFSAATAETLLSSTDSVARALEEAQFDLGEGPRWDAARTRLPVLVPELRESAFLRWPALAGVLAGLEVSALFVFPLTVGALDLGVVELYRDAPGALSGSELLDVEVLAGETAWALLRWTLEDSRPAGAGRSSIVDSAGPRFRSTRPPTSRHEVHQATGMVLAQAGVSAAQALLLMRGYAFSRQQTLHETALRVIRRELDFSPSGTASPEGFDQA